MKFALNGALTIGTDDGANVEIRELVGDDNFFLFGMSEPEVEALWARGYKPAEFYQADDNLRRAMDLIASGAFSGGDDRVRADRVEPALRRPVHGARRLLVVHRRAGQVDAAYADQDAWTRSAILNVARCGFFSSDRSMRDYIDRIWHTPPVI
jgi:starch phosphorylase